jgi:hypothetical protein
MIHLVPCQPRSAGDLPRLQFAFIYSRSIALLALAFAAGVCLACSSALGQDATDPKAQENAPQRGPGYVYRTLRFHDVDLARLIARLERFGVRIPITGTGQVDATIRVGLPIRNPFTWSAYHLEGTFSARQLVLEGVELRDLDASAAYKDGTLHIERLTVTLWDTQLNEAGGTFEGSADAQLAPRGELTARLNVNGLNVSELTRLAPNLPTISGGRAAGNVEARVPVEQARQLDAWRASGNLTLEQLQVENFPQLAVHTSFQFDRGALALNQLVANSGQNRVEADVQLSDRAPYPFRCVVRQARGQLEELAPLLARFGISEPISGAFDISGTASGNVQPLTWAAQGQARLTGVELRGLHLDAAQFAFAADRERVQINNVSAQAFGGTISGSGQLALANFQASADLAWSGLQVSDLLARFAPQSVSIAAVSRGRANLQVPAGAWSSPSKWQAAGNAVLESGRVQGVVFQQASARFELRNQSLGLFDARATFGTGGMLRAGARISLAAPYPFAINYDVRSIPIQLFTTFVGLAPDQLSGLASSTGSASGSLDPREINASGTATLAKLRAYNLRLDSASFAYAANRYGAAVDRIDATLYGGRVAGSAVIPFQTNVDAKAQLNWRGIDLGLALADLQLISEPVVAVSRGSLELTHRGGAELDWRKAIGSMRLDIDRLSGFGLRDATAAANVAINPGRLTVSGLRATWLQSSLTGQAEIALDDRFSFTARIAATGELAALPLRSLLPLGDQLAGKYQVRATVQGQAARPLTFSTSGSLSLASARVAGAAIDSLSLRFATGAQRVEIRDLQARLYGGSVSGSATLPLVDEAAGDAQLHLDEFDLGQLAKDVVKVPFQLSAVTSANLRVQMPPGTRNTPDEWTASGDLNAPSIEINRAHVGDLRASVSLDRETLTYHAAGHLFAGVLDLSGHWNAEQSQQTDNSGVLRLTGLQLSRLSPAFPKNPRLKGLSGRLDFHLPFSIGSKLELPTGAGELRIDQVRWRNLVLADRIESVVRLHSGLLELSALRGSFAGGALRGRVAIDLRQPTRSQLVARLDHVNLEQLLAPWENLRGLVTGSLDLEVRGVLGRPWRFAGTAAVTQGRALSVALSDVRVPFTLRFDPKTLATEIDAPDGAGQLGHGRFRLALTARAAQTTSLQLQANVTDADLQPLFAQAGVAIQMGSARVSGTVTLGGQSIRTLNDLTGLVRMRLRNVQPAALPGFQRLEPYLTGGLQGSSFSEGELVARIAGGALHIERFSLTSTSARLFASGRVALSGALDLAVAYSSYQLPGGMLGSALLARIPIAAATPVGLLITANQLLANRVVYLDVTGTISNMIVRVRPLPLLANEATRFFLGGAL